MITIDTILGDIRSGAKTVRTVVDEALQRAADVDEFHALLSLTDERARQRADAIDARLAAGEKVGRLAGVPFIVKDNYLTYGGTTTAAAHILEDFEAPLQATAIERLEAEGAICIGKANLDAFAHGGSTENSAFGPTSNAFDKSRVAGGSSGGSAVAVALDIAPFALGTDTGGSIRQPAGFNGVYGMKPTYGAVSRYGVVAMSSGLDTIGCFAHVAADVDVVMSVMAGLDPYDMTSIDGVYTGVVSAVKKKKIGIIKETMTDAVQPEVRDAVRAYADLLVAAGHEVIEVSMTMLKYSLAMYYIIVPAEVSSNLARYDGIRYGLRAGAAKTLSDVYGMTRDEGFEAENKRRIMIGSFVLSSGYFDAYYLQAQKGRTLLIQEYMKIFEEYDFLLTPTSPTTAFKLGENTDDPIKMYLADAMTVPPSLAGLPALSIPVGVDAQGLPIGAQLIGPYRSDEQLIAVAASQEAS